MCVGGHDGEGDEGRGDVQALYWRAMLVTTFSALTKVGPGVPSWSVQQGRGGRGARKEEAEREPLLER